MADYTAQIEAIYLAYYGRPADIDGLSYWDGALNEAGGNLTNIINAFGTATESTLLYSQTTNLAKVNAIYKNLFNRDGDTEGLIFYTGLLRSGTKSAASIALDILNGATGDDKILLDKKLQISADFTSAMQTDATAMLAFDGATATETARLMLSAVTADSDDNGVVEATLIKIKTPTTDTTADAQTFTLTTDTDTWTGGTGNDTFNASNSAGTAAAQTYNTGDLLTGGLGTDTLNATIGAASTFVLSDVTGIEVVNGNFTAAGTVSLLGSSGVTNVVSKSSTTAAIFSNIGSTDVELGITNSAVGATFGFTTAAVAGTADSVTLNLNNQTAGTNVIAGVETLNIVSETAANTITTLTTAATTAVVVTGSQDLTVPFGATVATVDASAFTGALSATMGAVAAATITGGAGNDSLTISAVTGTVSLDGGAGNDTVIAATNLTIADSLTGGDGTDALSSVFASVSTAGYVTPSTVTISGFETLSVSDAVTGAITTVGIDTGINALVMARGGTNTSAAVTFNTGAATLQIGTSDTTAGALNTALTVAATDTTAVDGDALTIINSNLSTVDAFGTTATIATTGYESVTINTGSYTTAVAQASGTIGVTGSSGFTSAETLKFAGANNFTAGVITADIIDASAMTSTTGTTLTTVTGTTATTVTGSGGNDLLFADTTSNVSVDGGAGNDTITGGAGNDVLVGGTGIDSITAAAGNDTVTAGAGNDTIVFAANFTTGDTLDGGDGTDTLSLTTAGLTTLAALSISAATALNTALSNVERLSISNAFDVGAAFDMARLDSIDHVTLVAGTTGAEELSGLAANSTIVIGDTSSLTATLADATGSADIINFNLIDQDGTASAETITAITASNIETVNIAATEATAATAVVTYTITTLSAKSTAQVNFTGTESVTVTNATSLRKVDGSGLTAGNLTISVANASSGATVVGGAGADVLTGSVNSDSITGGAGADSINGGALNDTIDGGAGSDTALYGGAGNDSITGGAGSDSIAGGAGNDAIVLTETTALTDSIYIGASDTGGTNEAIGATNIDTITGFTAGTGGDLLVFDDGAVDVTSATQKVATLSSDGATLTSLANTAVVGDVDVLIVLGSFGTYAAVQVILNATAGTITDATDGAIVVWTDDDGDTQVYYDTDISAGAGTGTQMAVLTGVAVENLVAANFDVIA